MDERMNEPEAAKYMGLPWRTVRRLRVQGIGPKHIIILNRPYYIPADLDKYLESVTAGVKEPEE